MSKYLVSGNVRSKWHKDNAKRPRLDANSRIPLNEEPTKLKKTKKLRWIRNGVLYEKL